MPAGSYKSHATGGGRNHSNNNNRNRQQQQQQQSSSSASTPSAASTSSAGGAGAPAPPTNVPLFNQYPISSTYEFTLKGDGNEKVNGTIYCTDAIAQMVVLTDEDGEFRLLGLQSIQSARLVQKATVTTQELLQEHANSTGNDAAQSRKLLEEREKRELKRMQESLKHIHPKATPKAQLMYDKLLKACNEVEWKQGGANGDVLSIMVMNQIQVDSPYDPESCRLVRAGTGEGNLDRIKKIVAAAAVTAGSST